MESTAAIIVGDIYSDLCSLPHVISVAELKRNLPQYMSEIGKKRFIAGQGIDRTSDINIVRLFASDFPHENEIAGPAFSHKHKSENALITLPRAAGPSQYISQMVIDRNCAEVSDHTTGSHIQGMVLTEAARQMILAVLESHLFEQHRRGTFYVVLDKLDAQFTRFAFPLPTSIRCTVDRHDVDKRGNVICTFSLAAEQSLEIVATFGLSVRCYEKSFMRKLEVAQAEAAVNQLVFSHSPAAESTGNQIPEPV